VLRAQQMGRQVAKLHAALASREDLPDFRPEPVTPDDIARWREEVAAQARTVFAELRRRRSEMRPADQALIAALLELEGSTGQRLAALLPDDIDALKIRHHGDLHLGQKLWVKDDVFILDFEGEPRRPIAERRRKGMAARDVAGVIRSIDYSATAALERAARLKPDDDGQMAAALDRWREDASLVFWEAYRSSLADARLWPAERAQSERLLDFFLLEKAIYEVGYELANRPDWLRVPLMGMLRILRGSTEQAAPDVKERA
jgi:maltose alpha-D-glucosyltransferase/alpha-amylase